MYILVSGSSSSASSGTTVQVYDSVRGGTIVGNIDNTNPTYTLPSVPLSSAAVKIHRSGLLQTQGVDYTILGAVVTTSSNLNFGETLDAEYTI